MDLVREYCARQSEPAFETLVHRHINLVYSTALRRVGNPAQAEEIAQAVFIIFARKAARLRPETVLAAWLHETVRYVAASFLRGEIRRRRREQEAYMQSTLQPNSDDSAWEQLAPLLDEAIGRLRTADRNVVALHYFQNKSAPEIAAVLNIGEAAAKKRLARAVEKLRLDFFKRGINVSTAALSGAVLTHSVQTAPAALAKSVAAVALAKGAPAPISTLTLIKGALKIMAWTKAKTAAVAVVAVIAATGTTTVIVKHIAAGPAPVLNAAVDDSYFEANDNKLASAPPNLLILRESRSARTSGPFSIAGYKGMPSGAFRMSGQGVSFDVVINTAFGGWPARIVYAADPPRNKFDFLVTVAEKQREALQAEIGRQYGLTARREMRPADVLLLKVKTARAPGLRAEPKGKDGGESGLFGGRYISRNMPIGNLAAYLEMTLKQPVLDQTGLTGNYTYEIPGAALGSPERLNAALLNQLGLELVPAREPVEMLVVEKLK